MKIVILGAGAWGTALAIHTAQHSSHQVVLWARETDLQIAMQQERKNARYLPDVALPHRLKISNRNLSDLLAEYSSNSVDLFVIASPMVGLRDMLSQLSYQNAPVAWLCKGFEADSGLLGHEIATQVAPHLIVGALSGPSFAQEVASSQPTALVAASVHASLRHLLVEAFHTPFLRVYANSDLIGAEVGGAVKNVLAIATGLCDGLNLGLNARAALITRGLAEITRLGLALGAQIETFMGLSGLGDLVLTTTGNLSRNRQIGLLLAKGQTLEQAVASLGHVAEGVYSAKTVVQRAEELGLEMPIAQSVVALLEGQLKPQAAVAALMGRDARSE